jgi:subtilase family serine protease
MRKRWVVVVVVAAAAAVLFAQGGRGSAAPPSSLPAQAVCAAALPGSAHCHALVVDNSAGKPGTSATPSGYGPADIQSAYGLAGQSSGGRTVAIVDAYDDPTAESDLAVYRQQLGLSACTTGCFAKVSQIGSNTYPSVNSSWAAEISLDLDMVSAACPDCHILLVEANSASFADLSTAVGYAAGVPGVIAISNSYGGSDTSSIAAYENAGSGGIAVTASTGDSGYGVEAPASFTHVVAVGGTTLSRTTSGFSETAWSGSGSGCSKKNLKPSWQSAATKCSGKANADVSAVADPNTGVSVYDTTPLSGQSGWMVFGGTSVSSPIIASVYALANNFGSSAGEYTWGHAASLHDVTSGANSHHCSPSLWCKAGTGWDGPTGLGTPNGTGGF